jgi:hypothetical protein
MMTRLSENPLIHPDCELTEVTFGRFTEVGRGSRIQNSHLDDYSYCDRLADIANAQIRQYCGLCADRGDGSPYAYSVDASFSVSRG